MARVDLFIRMQQIRGWESDVLNTQRFVCPGGAGVAVAARLGLGGEKESNPVSRDRHKVQLNMTTRFYGVDYLYGDNEDVFRR